MKKSDRSMLSELVSRCRRGDKEAWNQLIEMVTPLVFSICRTMQLSREESFDIFGQVSYLLLSNLDRLRSPEKILSYVATTTRREVFALNRRARLFEYLGDLHWEDKGMFSDKTPDKMYEQMKNMEMLMKAIVLLPKRDYELIKALFLDTSEPSYEEIAKRLRMPVSSIGPTRARSLAKLKRILKKKGFEF
jgi:RNA polymerase sigma factor (sigma-70 family)